MNGGEAWVGRIATVDLVALAPWRGRGGWEWCAGGGEHSWLRVPMDDEGIFRQLPLLGRWVSDAAGHLVREGRRVPDAVLPETGWSPLSAVLMISTPPRGAPGMPPPAVGFRLERDEVDRPAQALLCHGGVFSAWAETAFAPRLECLRFARANDNRVFVTGLPLPAIPGAGFHPDGKLWLPCGYRLPDHAWAGLLEERLGLGRNRSALLHPDGSHEKLDEENRVSATRAAVRRTFAD